LIVPLLDTLREAVLAWGEQHRSATGVARQTAATVGRAMASILAGISMKVGLPGAVELSYDANKSLDTRRRLRGEEADARVSRSFYHASFTALRDTFERFVREAQVQRIVVFIDDLDRCLPDSALQVLESMKLFFDLAGFVFVVGLDNEIVQSAIDSKYRRSADEAMIGRVEGEASTVSGAEYVKKIFQLPYSVRPVAIDQLDDFLVTAYAEAKLPDQQRAELDQTARLHMNYLVGGSAVNPREIKRYVNSYTVVRKIEPDLDRNAVLAWQTIRFRDQWDLVRRAVLERGTVFTSAVAQRVSGVSTALSDVDPELDSIPDDFLDYVSLGNPGNPFLMVADLDRYIASGEAVGSTVDQRLLGALRALGEVRGWITDSRRKQAVESQGLSTAKGDMSEALSAASTSVPTLLATRIQDDINTFVSRVQELDDPEGKITWEQLHPTLDELERLERSIRTRFQRLHGRGSVGTTQTAR
jgi:KAP family P-loop domain